MLNLNCVVWTSADYSKGFGGKFGVETDKVDKSALGFEYQGKTERHESQKGERTLDSQSSSVQRTYM